MLFRAFRSKVPRQPAFLNFLDALGADLVHFGKLFDGDAAFIFLYEAHIVHRQFIEWLFLTRFPDAAEPVAIEARLPGA